MALPATPSNNNFISNQTNNWLYPFILVTSINGKSHLEDAELLVLLFIGVTGNAIVVYYTAFKGRN